MDLETTFQDLRDRREGAHMPHVYYGDPNETFSLKLIETLVQNGADLLELGIPFSDPTADGPTFQAACERALTAGITPSKCIQGIHTLRRMGIDIPIIVTTYYNIPYILGISPFLRELQRAGVQAILVPNLPVEEANELIEEGKMRGIHVILQIAPTTTAKRLKKIIDVASGFLYVVNVEGVTGVREHVASSTLNLIHHVKRQTNIPILAGFGISQREHAAALVAAGTDGAVVGSAYARLYAESLYNPEETLPAIAQLAHLIKQGCIEGYRDRVSSHYR